jgi:hypothetical protein
MRAGHRRPARVMRRPPALVLGLLLLTASCTGSPGAVTAPPATTASASTAPRTTAAPSTAALITTTRSTPTTGSSGTATAAASTTPQGTAVHDLPDGVAPEASGLARSAGGLFYTVDDGTGTDELIALRPDGSLVARIRVAGMSTENAEALASAPCEQGTCLFVGDIGNRRDTVTIYRIPEPAGPPWFADSKAWTYTYPDGRHNAEAMFVAPDGQLVVITKSAPDSAGAVPPHRIYRAPPGGGELTLVRTFTPPQPAVPRQSLITGTVVTDAFYDGKRVLLLTYDQVISYTAPEPGADPTGFPDWPRHNLPMPPVPQAEGITGTADGCGYAVASEAGPLQQRGVLAVMPCAD